jgi:hypothetical protein
MKVEELNFQESGLIEILRAFVFLRQEGYHEKEITIGGRSNPSIIYHSYIKNRTLHVIGDESQSWTIIIQRKKTFSLHKYSYVFDISNYYEHFNCGLIKGRNYSLKSQADFIQQHLMPVIRGHKWIDEIIKQKN